MQGNSFPKHPSASRTRFGNRWIGCQRRSIAGILVCLPILTPTRASANGLDHVGYYGKRNSQQWRAERRSAVEFAPEG